MEIMKRRSFGFSFIRILPKKNGVRPILNFRRKPGVSEKEIFTGYHNKNPPSINYFMDNSFYVIKHEKVLIQILNYQKGGKMSIFIYV